MRRVLHLIFILAAIACFFASGYALNWIWNVKKPAIDTTTYAFREANKYLTLADDAMNDVKGNLEVARLQMLRARASVGGSAGGEAGNGGGGLFGDPLARILVRQVVPNVNNVQSTVEKVTEASMVVNSILESVQEVPLGPKDRLDTQQVRNLQQQLHGVTNASWELGDLLDNPQPGDANAAAKADRISQNLATIIDMTGQFQDQVRALQARADRYEKTTLFWMNWIPTIASWVLGWVMLSQVLLIVYIARDARTIS